MRMPPVIHVVGRRNAGKTTLVCDLISSISASGLRVGSVKHTHHQHELDTPGKDSHRHRTAGAVAVGILSPQMTAMFIPGDREAAGDDRYAAFRSMFATCDLIIVEGDLQARATKLEVWRREMAEPPYAVSDPTISAVISDDAVQGVTCALWKRTPIEDVARQSLHLLGKSFHDLA
jgi:molybdopterin-guanine dinucleotide biosynthesis protein B